MKEMKLSSLCLYTYSDKYLSFYVFIVYSDTLILDPIGDRTLACCEAFLNPISGANSVTVVFTRV